MPSPHLRLKLVFKMGGGGGGGGGGVLSGDYSIKVTLVTVAIGHHFEWQNSLMHSWLSCPVSLMHVSFNRVAFPT